MPFRPETRPDPPTDERVAELARQFPADTLIGSRARIERDLRLLEALDFQPTLCMTCEHRAQWEGRGYCPRCHVGIFRTSAHVYVCDPCRTSALAQLARFHDPKCDSCGQKVTLAEVHAAVTWTRL